MRILQVSIGLLILALLGVVVFLDYGRRSPGPIAAVHGSLPELGPMGAGKDAHSEAGCQACHGDGKRSLAEACNGCHQEIGEQLQSRQGVHGRLPAAQVQHCGRCHGEHHGEDFRLVTDHTFEQAGLAKIADYRHQELGRDYGLAGKHTGLGCEQCHKHARDVVLQKGHKRFLGLNQDCVSCHDDPHAGKLGDCASCHGQEKPFAQVALFEHDKRFPLEHRHAGLGCKQCHEPGSRWSIENVGSFRTAARTRATGPEDKPRTLTVRGCVDCHESPHTQGYLQAVAQRVNVAGAAATCTTCHKVEHESFQAADEGKTHELHGATGFDLVVPHREVACAKCHPGPSRDQKYNQKYTSPPRRQQDCRGCHGDPHAGQFDRPRHYRNDCLACHPAHTFKEHRVDRQQHERLFALVGAHRELGCEACHALEDMAGTKVRRFRGTARTCTGCHQDPHGDQFQHGPFRDQACTACHTQVRFRPAAFTLAMHQRTRFPLDGAHLAVACNQCHVTKDKDKQPVYRGTATACSSCHADVHDGAFDRRGLPATVGKNAGCARCHDTRQFQLGKGQKFDHGRWTSFELTGAHATAACSKCHPPTTPSHGGTRRMAKAKGDCASCHQDPHAGQFREPADGARGRGTDCSRCHTVKAGFDLTHFDHDKQSRFKLDEKHRSLRCDQCHKRYRLASGATVVRYKPLGTKCNDCHGWEDGGKGRGRGRGRGEGRGRGRGRGRGGREDRR